MSCKINTEFWSKDKGLIESQVQAVDPIPGLIKEMGKLVFFKYLPRCLERKEIPLVASVSRGWHLLAADDRFWCAFDPGVLLKGMPFYSKIDWEKHFKVENFGLNLNARITRNGFLELRNGAKTPGVALLLRPGNLSFCKLQELAKDPKAGTIIPFEEPCELFQREYQRLTEEARIIAITEDIIPESDGWSQEDKINKAEACKLRIIDVATYLLVTGNASAVLHQYVVNATYCVENYTYSGDDEFTDDFTYNATVGTWNNSILVSYNVASEKDGVGQVWNGFEG